MNEHPSLDDQMVEAVRNQMKHVAASHAVDRRGWTRDQWVADAEKLMGDLDGSVMDLKNGHVLALLEELHELRKAVGRE